MKFKLIGAPIALYKLFKTGAEAGPEAIRKELEIKFSDLKLKNLSQEKANSKIKKKAKEIFNSGEKPFFIGGDHSITFPILSAFERPFDLFWFDAHPDANDFYGCSKISHACGVRRIAELFKCKHIYLIGNRAYNPSEKEFLKISKKVVRIKLHEIKKMRSPRYYVSIDIDVLDPKYAPAVDHTEPRGLRISKLLEAIKYLKRGNIIGADLVELVPDNDHSGKTEKCCVEIIKEFIK